METSPVITPDPHVDPSLSVSNTSNNNSTSYGVLLNLFHSPLSLLLEYSRVASTTSNSAHQDSDPVGDSQTQLPNSVDNLSSVSPGEVSIQIIRSENGESETTEAMLDNEQANPLGAGEALPLVPPSVEGNTSRDASYRSYDIQQFARWFEQVLPFSLLLLVVFIRQHLQGFFITVWITAMIFKSNDILRKQTALKGERKNFVLIVISIGFMLHVVGIYWWFQHDDLLYPLVLIPLKTTPPFWHAVFIILVNDTMVRQAVMAFKCLLLIYYKSGRGHNFRRQGQMLTLVEYALLLYRALLPAPVWYRFFLNKDYGSLFSSLTAGLYLTFKLTTIVEKVQSLFAAFRALSRKEVHYGSYATMEQFFLDLGDRCFNVRP
ncbi:E3 ubiquitin-protein ligase RNFT1-like isoform X2 [Mangifera indica]|uniref:E3 ubiquitin-protein ligase RNFT1-like isoform X2 n=1 Tax=Mangifera indica TaxID=29780 RepID=UPI001CFC07D3|nr:E3 ubiquitin-protein ligase RNFT1-like isoform X2 [Mangifera indica]